MVHAGRRVGGLKHDTWVVTSTRGYPEIGVRSGYLSRLEIILYCDRRYFCAAKFSCIKLWEANLRDYIFMHIPVDSVCLVREKKGNIGKRKKLKCSQRFIAGIPCECKQ